MVFPGDVVPQDGSLDLSAHFREIGDQSAGAVQLRLYRIADPGISRVGLLLTEPANDHRFSFSSLNPRRHRAMPDRRVGIQQ